MRRELPQFLTRDGDRELFADLIHQGPVDGDGFLFPDAPINTGISSTETTPGYLTEAAFQKGGAWRRR